MVPRLRLRGADGEDMVEEERIGRSPVANNHQRVEQRRRGAKRKGGRLFGGFGRPTVTRSSAFKLSKVIPFNVSLERWSVRAAESGEGGVELRNETDEERTHISSVERSGS